MALKGKRVLLVDDDPDITALIKKVLDNAGLFFDSAGTVKEGIEKAKKNPPHLMILDIGLPEEDGFSLLTKRLMDAFLMGIPILMLSGNKDMPSVKKAVALGAASYMIKPFESGLLLQKIRKILHDTSEKEGTWQLPKAIRGTLSVGAEIVRINPEDALIESPVRLAPGFAISLESDLLVKLGCKTRVLRSVTVPLYRALDAIYQVRARFMGITEDEQKSMSKELATWTKKNQ